MAMLCLINRYLKRVPKVLLHFKIKEERDFIFIVSLLIEEK
jgi:hypothetical protein